MSVALGEILRRLAQAEVREARKNPAAYLKRVRKAKGETPEDEIRRLLLRFGLRRAADAAKDQAGTFGLEVLIPRTLESDALAGKEIKIKVFQTLVDGIVASARSITRETQRIIREDVRRTLAIAQAEKPQPSNQEIARRIARTAFSDKKGEKSYAFSFERANLIARTEMVQAENTGIVAGMELAGVERVEWLAYTDGKSGDRHHERMDGKIIAMGETFTTPLGNRLRYPGDPMAPIEDTANCRCTIAPARRTR